MQRETALLTKKFSLRLSISLRGIAACRAFSAGIAGINKNHWHSGDLRFVVDKGGQLSKSPFAELFPLRLSNRYPETLEVFKDDTSLGVLGDLNDPFGNGVIGGPLETPFSARQSFEVSFGRRGSAFLQSPFKFSSFHANLVNISTREAISIRGGSQVYDSKINPKASFGVERCAIGQFDTEGQKEFPFPKNQIGLSPDTPFFKVGIFAKNDGNFEPTIDAKDAYNIQASERKDALIIDYGGMGFEYMRVAFLSSIGFGNFTDGPNRKLSRKTIDISDIPITEMMQTYLSKLLLLPGYFGNIVTGLVKNLHGFYQGGSLLFSWKQFNHGRDLHGRYGTKQSIGCQDKNIEVGQ